MTCNKLHLVRCVVHIYMHVYTYETITTMKATNKSTAQMFPHASHFAWILIQGEWTKQQALLCLPCIRNSNCWEIYFWALLDFYLDKLNKYVQFVDNIFTNESTRNLSLNCIFKENISIVNSICPRKY